MRILQIVRRFPPSAAFLSAFLCACSLSGSGGGDVEADVASEDREALGRLDALVSEGQFIRAGELADSLYSSWRFDSRRISAANRALFVGAVALQTAGESEEAAARLEALIGRSSGTLLELGVYRLAEIRVRGGQEAAAIEMMLAHPTALNEEARRLMREAAGSVTLVELEEIAGAAAPGPPGGLLKAELARALALAGREQAAQVAARQVLEADSWSPDRDLARQILEGGYLDAARIRVGLVIPKSGRFAAAGELVEEGARIALLEYRRTAGALPIELVIEDDNSGNSDVGGLMASLERQGVVAVMGPMRSETFSAAWRSRRDDRLLLVSPTATEVDQPGENAFTLWSKARRHTDVARDLARFLGGDVGLRRLGVLYPMNALGQSSYRSFEEAAHESGAAVVTASAYRPDTTTFQDPIGRLSAGMPEAIFVDADELPTVLQLTPQIPYYGIEGSIIAGSALWGAPEALRRLEGTLGNAWIVGAYIDRSAELSPWATFKDLYEGEYRKSLRDNMLPALGYDAMRVILSAITRSGTADPARVSRAARELEVAGATGLFRLDAASSTVVRTTLIRALRDGELVPLDVASLLAWRDAEAEEAARRAEAEEESKG